MSDAMDWARADMDPDDPQSQGYSPPTTPAPTAFETKDLERPCRHCGRPLVLFQSVPMHASAWDAGGQREIYRHCRVHVAEPAGQGEQPQDLLERETALTRYFSEAGLDWRKPDELVKAGLVAYRAAWTAARA